MVQCNCFIEQPKATLSFKRYYFSLTAKTFSDTIPKLNLVYFNYSLLREKKRFISVFSEPAFLTFL